MKYSFILVLTVLVLLASARQQCKLLPDLPRSISNSKDALLKEQRKASAALAKAYAKKDVDTMMSYVADPYIQHNPNIKSGKGVAQKYIKQRLSAKGLNNKVTRVISDLNYVVLHVHRTTPGKKDRALADIYRLNGTCIVEHWDVQQDIEPRPKNPKAFF